MTLQVRLRESAKDLVRLLEEDLEAKKFMPEFRESLEEPLYIETKRGKEYNPKLFNYPGAYSLRIVLNKILRMEETIISLQEQITSDKQAYDSNPPSADTQPMDSSLSHDTPVSGTNHNLQGSHSASKVAPASERKDDNCPPLPGNLCIPEVIEVLLPVGSTVFYRLIDFDTSGQIRYSTYPNFPSAYPR